MDLEDVSLFEVTSLLFLWVGSTGSVEGQTCPIKNWLITYTPEIDTIWLFNIAMENHHFS